MLLLLLACTSAAHPLRPEPADWPRPLLVSVSLAPPEAQLLDAREAADYARGHAPGAVNANWRELALRDAAGVWGPAEPEAAAALLAARGLRADTPVVVMDDWRTSWGGEGYLYWTLRRLGVEDVRLLEGGWQAWEAAGAPVTTAAPPPGDFKVKRVIDVLATTEMVAKASVDGSAVVLDVRTTPEWLAGHIPGSKHLLYSDLADDMGRPLPPDALREALAGVGLTDPEQPVITTCTGGIRAGHTFFVLELMGYEHVRDYVGSWWAWTAQDQPVVRGP